jgi:hypothetical protein
MVLESVLRGTLSSPTGLPLELTLMIVVPSNPVVELEELLLSASV